jgi:hypothetical protein
LSEETKSKDNGGKALLEVAKTLCSKYWKTLGRVDSETGFYTFLKNKLEGEK